jgi:hypothetical protein
MRHTPDEAVNRLLLLLAVLAGCITAAGITHAYGERLRDPRGDVKGSKVLDIASVGDAYRAGVVEHRLTTYGGWKRTLLASGGQISFYFNTDDDRAYERRLDVRYAHGGLSAVMRSPRGRQLGTGWAVRRSRTVIVRFARSLLRPGIRRYGWFAFAGVRCRHRYTTCGDTAPNGGTLITQRVGVAPPRPARQPSPIAGKGYRETFSDEFDVLDHAVWTRNVWWDSPVAADELYARDGVLHLVSRRSRGYPGVATTTYEPARGARQKRTFRLGYFEARVKIPQGNGSWPAFWLYSKGQADGTTSANLPNSEIDIFDLGEGQRLYFGGVHKNTNSCCGVSDVISPEENWRELRYDLSARWHTFSALWTASAVTFYIDARRVMRSAAWASTNQEHLLIFDEWTGGWGRPVDSSTPDVLDLQVDWVRVWQKRG